MISPDAFARRLVELGLPLDQSGDFYGYSLALGSADVRLLSLTNAYRAFAAGGLYSPARYLLDAPGRVQGIERSEEHTSELQSLMRISYAVFCLKNKNQLKQT